MQGLYEQMVKDSQQFQNACAGAVSDSFSLVLHQNELVFMTRVAGYLQDLKDFDPDLTILSERAKTGLKFTNER